MRLRAPLVTALAVASMPLALAYVLTGTSSHPAVMQPGDDPSTTITTPVDTTVGTVVDPVITVLAPVASAPVVLLHPVLRPLETAVRPTEKIAQTEVSRTRKQAVAKPVFTGPNKSASAVPFLKNDYPWADVTGNALDRFGFTERQCVSFSAWRLSEEGKALDNGTQGWGDASNWDNVAKARGVGITTAPRVGAIAQWNADEQSIITQSDGSKAIFEAGHYGHVGYVAKVYSDGTALIESYNADGGRTYGTLRMTAPRYLVF